MQNRIDFLIEFWTDFLKILAPVGHHFGFILTPKIVQNGATLKGTSGLWRRLRAEGAQGYPQTPKMDPRGSPRPQK